MKLYNYYKYLVVDDNQLIFKFINFVKISNKDYRLYK